MEAGGLLLLFVNPLLFGNRELISWPPALPVVTRLSSRAPIAGIVAFHDEKVTRTRPPELLKASLDLMVYHEHTGLGQRSATDGVDALNGKMNGMEVWPRRTMSSLFSL